MLVSPTNNLIVKVKPKWIRHFSSIMKIAAITDESNINPADIVNIVGEVVSVPKKIETQRREYKNFSCDEIKAGDTVLFSYRVVFDLQEVAGEYSEPVYTNRFIYKGEEYFTASITEVFAYIRDGEIKMINDWAIMSKYAEQAIILPQYYRKNRRAAQSELSHIGANNKTDVQRGDTVFFDPMKTQHYRVNQKDIVIFKGKDFLAKEV